MPKIIPTSTAEATCESHSTKPPFTEIPSIDEIEDPGVDVTVKAAVPGYLSDLTEELSNDLASETELDPNSMEARMRAELSTDEVTAAAEAKAAAEKIINEMEKVR